MFVVTLSDVISIGVMGLLIIGFIIYCIYAIIRTWFNRHFRQNCYKCKHWYLYNVAGSGGICWYKCKQDCIKEQVRQEFNDQEYYMKCSKFEEEDKQ